MTAVERFTEVEAAVLHLSEAIRLLTQEADRTTAGSVPHLRLCEAIKSAQDALRRIEQRDAFPTLAERNAVSRECRPYGLAYLD